MLLIERGPVADNWVSRVPLLSSDFSSNRTRSQRRVSEYQPELGRSIELVHGSALGGTSRINQMLYVKGSPRDYDGWAEEGCTGWAWKDTVASECIAQHVQTNLVVHHFGSRQQLCLY